MTAKYFVSYKLGNVREQFGLFDGLYEALEKVAALIAIHGKRMPIEINDGTSSVRLKLE